MGLEYRDFGLNKVYTFPLTESEGATYTLTCLKQGVMYKILSSSEELPNSDPKQSKKSCLSYDTYFKVLRANAAVFHVDKDSDKFIDDEDQKAFEQAYSKKNYVIAVICTSDKNQRSTMFTIVKERDELNFIKQVRLLKSKQNRKDLEVDVDEDDVAPMHSFYITANDFGDNRDNYAQVSEKMIKIYDKSMNLRLKFEGLKIRHCEDVHQDYLYTISDQMDRPYKSYSRDNDF